jgi:streptogramin lyase
MTKFISRLAASILLMGALGGPAPASARTFIDHLQGFPERGFRAPGPGKGPVDVLVGPDAMMWVLDADGSLWRLAGRTLRRVTRPAEPAGRQMAVDGWGRVAQLVHNRNGQIVLRRVYPDGRASDVPIRGRADPDPNGDVISGPGGAVWFFRPLAGFTAVAPKGRARNVRIPKTYPGGSAVTPPGGLIGSSLDVGSDGSLWFDNGLSAGRFTPTGTFLPPVRLEPDGSTSSVLRVARGSDDAMWAGVTGNVYVARIDPRDQSVTKHQIGVVYSIEAAFWAMAAGPGASIWSLDGSDFSDSGDQIAFDALEPIGPQGLLAKDVPYLRDLPHDNSAEHFGLVAGLDGRMWFTERLFGKLEAWRSPWWKPSPRGRTRVLGTHRVGKWMRVDLGCVGTTGGYCTGSLQLRANGRRIGRAARYAVAAGPPAVRSRSARWLPIPRADRGRGVRLTVQRHRVPGL